MVCLVTLSVATEAQVKGHMCWSSAFDPFEGSTLGSKSVPGGRTDRSREPSRARAVRRLGVPVGMGGKANCLCLRGIWETPKPRYREETKPVVKLPGTTFVPKIPFATPGRGGEIPRHGDRGAERQARRLTCAERHERVSRGVSAPRCVFGHLRGLCEWFECPLSRPGRDRLAAAPLPRRARRRLGRHHRHADDASGGAAEGGAIAGEIDARD